MSIESSTIRVMNNRMIPMADGVRLKADVYLPAEDCRRPVLLCYSPFGKEVQAMAMGRVPIRTGQAMFDQTIEICDIQFFINNGYGIVAASPRGVGNSQGTNHGFLSLNDQRDCCEVIDWIARQDFCDGNVGMMGTGFAGRIQPLVAAMGPKPLKAIMPIDLTDDLYQEYYPGGVRSDSPFAYDAMIPANSWECESLHTMGEAAFKEKLELLKKEDEMVASSYTWRAIDSWPVQFHPFTVDCFVNDKNNEFWQSRSFNGILSKIKIPVYAVSFLYEFGRSTVSAVNMFMSEALNVPKKLMLAEAGFNKRQPCDQLNHEMLRFYDYWLKHMDNGVMEEKAVKVWVMSGDKMLEGSTWPAAAVSDTKFYFSQNGLLGEEAGSGSADCLHHCPPTKVSQNKNDIPFIEYETRPFTEDVLLSGNVSASLSIAIDKKDANMCVYMWDVAPDGTMQMLSSGILKASRRVMDSADRHIPVTPDAICEYRIEMTPVSVEIKKEHRIRIHFKAMDYPIFNPSEKRSFALLFPSGRVIGPIPGTEFVDYKVYHSDENQSYITLPTVKR